MLRIFFRQLNIGFLISVSWLTSFACAELTFDSSWEMPGYDQVRTQMLAWLDSAELAEDVDFQARSLWPAGNLRATDGQVVDRDVGIDPHLVVA